MSVWDRAADLFVAPLRAASGSATSWRPCAECVALGGYDPAVWPRHRPDGSLRLDNGWPCEGHSHGRPSQIAPEGDWWLWYQQRGRGGGKTRSYAEWMLERRLRYPGTIGSIAMPRNADIRLVALEGESGLVTVMRARGLVENADFTYNRTLAIVTFANGSQVQGFSSEAPEAARGRQSHDLVTDEPGSFRDGHLPRDAQLRFNLKLGHRLPMPDGSPGREVVTGTPRRTPLVREILARAKELAAQGRAVLAFGSSLENVANLSAQFVAETIEPLMGTALGAQEVDGQMLDDVEGALWSMAVIDAGRVVEPPMLQRRVVAVDPAASESPTGDMVGIIGAGATNDHGYVLGDWSTRGLPETWAGNVVAAVRQVDAHAVVVETNFVGTWITRVLRDALDKAGLERTPIVGVHAGKGQTKSVRAEPVSMLYSGDRPRVHHVGSLPLLEDEQTTWVPGQTKRSPNRVDALVWAMHDLLLDAPGPAVAVPPPASYGVHSLPRY